MSKTRDTGYLNNILQYTPTGVSFVSGSTTLLSVSSSGNLTTTGTITAQTLVVQTVTSSISFVTGSTKFGALASNTHQFTGSMLVSGSVTANGTLQVTTTSNNGITITTNDIVTLRMNTSVGTTKNWGFATTNLAASDFGIYQSTSNGGDAITAGSAKLYFSGTGAATFSGSVNVNGLATSANYKLGVTGAAFISGTNNKGVFITDGASYASIVGLNSAIAAYNPLEIRASGTDYQLYLTTGGSVGIGTNNPSGRLQINGAGGSEISFQLNDSGTRRCFFIPSQYYGYMWGCQIVANGGKMWSFGNDAGSEVGYIQINSGGVVYSTTSSDIRKKKNFEKWEENILPYFKDINPQKFNFNIDKDNEPKTKGFIAQEMYDRFPEAYPLDLDGFHSFHPGGMVVYLMKAIQELKAENDTLKEILQRNNIQ
jgi:hypothetical protein